MYPPLYPRPAEVGPPLAPEPAPTFATFPAFSTSPSAVQPSAPGPSTAPPAPTAPALPPPTCFCGDLGRPPDGPPDECGHAWHFRCRRAYFGKFDDGCAACLAERGAFGTPFARPALGADDPRPAGEIVLSPAQRWLLLCEDRRTPRRVPRDAFVRACTGRLDAVLRAGVRVPDLLAAGASWRDLRTLGFSRSHLADPALRPVPIAFGAGPARLRADLGACVADLAGWTAEDLLRAGIDLPTIVAWGATPESFAALAVSYDEWVSHFGITADAIVAIGLASDDFRRMGWPRAAVRERFAADPRVRYDVSTSELAARVVALSGADRAGWVMRAKPGCAPPPPPPARRGLLRVL